MTVLTRTYMDWNATAPLLPAVREVLVSALDLAGNPSSVHREGRAARAAVETARREVAALGGAEPAHVTFTSGATEAANLVLVPEFRMGRSPVRVSRLYVSAIEHPAFREGGRFEKSDVTEVPVTSAGVLDLAALEALLSSHDRSSGLPMVACMLVNNETGVLQPVAEAARLVHAAGGLMVVDAVQAAGRVPLNINALDADFLVISSHKLGGPKGAGALISRGEVMMPKPLIHGGGQEKGHRSGTENTLSVIGFGAAAAFASRNVEVEAARLSALRARLENGMRVNAPDVIIHGDDVMRVANTTFFTLPGLKAETGQIAFDIEGIALSAGSACSSGKVGESHVLTAMGRDPKLGALRISIGHATDEADIERTLAAFAKIAGRRKLSGQAA
ncbi:cysteine desulfurase family protein [Agrobacterium pusense]|uniref:Cysteine desulfurase n=1 Tax=Agrobacterium pusense TaxID=648995 RepID=A0A6H0ZLN5_9HYPH|nr:cysteine desulfurase family protein [Agrobacterium pusense]ANV23135.1 cysteine desulfurase [Rhizobium sp. S41]KGE81317.1 cysteine desulfurase [Rhizobium sp. H41]HAU75148.1 cysteine desulfurase [Agrobacterium sp.]MDH0871959.1 cysteine desulfurase [Agrobacterium pusense]MDH1267816.1 cysteine desulfurase [Agrobacterium pusense]